MNDSYRNTQVAVSLAARKNILVPCIPLIAGFSLIILACLFARAGTVVNILFPAGAMAIAMYLLRWNSFLYIGFNWWLYFLAPFVRRVADWGGGFTETSPVLLAPYLASLPALLFILKYLKQDARNLSCPFIISAFGILYAYIIGILNISDFVTTSIALLDWIVPIIFGLYIALQWRDYPAHKENFKKIFLWGLLVMSGYGIIQFLICPPWETYWFQSSYFGGQGTVEALNMRVYSTMNSVEPFSAYMSYGLFSLFETLLPLTAPVSVMGYITFLLTQGRSAWIGFCFGLITLCASLNQKHQMRLILGVLALAICVFPLVTMEPFSSLLGERFSTFSDLENDGSALARHSMFGSVIDQYLFNAVGLGIGSPGFDSSFLTCLVSLGWIGTIAYGSGILMLVYKMFAAYVPSSDRYFIIIKAATSASLLRLFVNNPTYEISGIPFWGFIGLGIASIEYHHRSLLSSSAIRDRRPLLFG